MALEYAVEAVAALSTPTDAVTAVIVVADRSRLVAALHRTAAVPRRLVAAAEERGGEERQARWGAAGLRGRHTRISRADARRHPPTPLAPHPPKAPP